MPKRGAASAAAAASGSTPAPKQPRVDGPSPATAPAARPHGRVVLDVGGTRFVSSRSTLERASTYFRALLTRWDDDGDEPLFIDCDADAFQILLSYMRLGALTLPQHDEALCIRVLLHAEYLGLESLLEEVKVKAHANMHPDGIDGDEHPAVAFDAEVGSLADAVASKVLPARYFAAAPKPEPEPPERVVKALMPAPPGTHAFFSNAYQVDHGEARDEDGDPSNDEEEKVPVVNFALVEHRDGTQTVDAVVQRSMESTKVLMPILQDDRNAYTHSQLHFASSYPVRGRRGGPTYANWLIVPPRPPGTLQAIPPGSVSGTWRKPAFTHADRNKSLTIVGKKVTVDGETRFVDWRDDAPTDVTDARIAYTIDWNSKVNESHVGLVGGRRIELPPLSGEHNKTTMAMPFAMLEGDEGDNLRTRFFMPLAQKDDDSGVLHTELIDATGVRFGDNQFYTI